MTWRSDAERKRNIRDEALSRFSEREQRVVARLAEDVAAMRDTLARQEERLDALVLAISRLEELLASGAGEAPEHARPRPLTPLKRQILERVRDMRSRGLSFARICHIFREERVPTLSGEGQWSKGTLWNLWKSHRRQLEKAD